MTRIFLENNELDVNQEFSNQITYAIDDLNNLDSKSTSFSKTIILSGTTNNNNLLGNIFDFNNANFSNHAEHNIKYNFDASVSAKCRIEVNGLQICKGVFRLLQIIYEKNYVEYECAIFGELGGFVNKLGALKLEDLDFSDYDHVLSQTNIEASWNNANSGTGIFYSLIDYGAVSTGTYGTIKKDYQFSALRPSLHVREYLDKIITNAGYTWNSNFFDTDFFKRLGIPNNQKTFQSLSSYFFDGDYTGPQGMVTSSVPTYISPAVYFTTVSYIKNFTYSSGIFTNTSGQILSVNIDFSGDFYYYSQNRPISIDGYVNGSQAGNYGYLSPTGNQVYQNSTYTGTKIFIIPIGGTFQIKLSHANDGTTQYFDCILNYRFARIFSTVNILANVQFGDRIIMADMIPKGYFQKDFFTSILKMFYLMVTEDKSIDKHLVIEPFDIFYYLSASERLDWSDKVDYSKPIKIKPMSEINSRYYELKYKSDNDYYNELYKKKYTQGYGDRIYDNNLEFAKEKESVEVMFSNTPLLGYSGEAKIVPTIFKKNNNIEEAQEHNIRIMQMKKVSGVASWNIMNVATTLFSSTDYGYSGHLDDPDAPDSDLCFGVPAELFMTLVSGNLSNNLFNGFYSSYFAEITDKDSRLIECNVKLNEVDINNLDFSKFIFFNGGLYRLQRIIDYTPNEITKVEMLRVIYTTY